MLAGTALLVLYLVLIAGTPPQYNIKSIGLSCETFSYEQCEDKSLPGFLSDLNFWLCLYMPRLLFNYLRESAPLLRHLIGSRDILIYLYLVSHYYPGGIVRLVLKRFLLHFIIYCNLGIKYHNHYEYKP